MGILLTAAAAFGVAAFSPLLVARLLPITEAALVAQGVAGSPVRAGHQGLMMANTLQMVTGRRCSQLASGKAGSGEAGGAGAGPQGGAPPPGTGAPAAGGSSGAGAGAAGAGAAATGVGVAVVAAAKAVETTKKGIDAGARAAGETAQKQPRPPSLAERPARRAAARPPNRPRHRSGHRTHRAQLAAPTRHHPKGPRDVT